MKNRIVSLTLKRAAAILMGQHVEPIKSSDEFAHVDRGKRAISLRHAAEIIRFKREAGEE